MTEYLAIYKGTARNGCLVGSHYPIFGFVEFSSDEPDFNLKRVANETIRDKLLLVDGLSGPEWTLEKLVRVSEVIK